MLTYGDGVSDVDITSLLSFHRSHGRLALSDGSAAFRAVRGHADRQE